MTKKVYAVNLDEEVVKAAKEKLKEYGGRLSPIINNLLKEWIAKEKAKLKKLRGRA